MITHGKLVGVTLLIAAVPSVILALQDEPIGVKKFRKTLEAQSATIIGLAHPLGNCKTIDFDGYKKIDDGHELTCTIVWTSVAKNEFATTFLFTFKLGLNDQVQRLKITVPKDTCPTKAWKGANLLLGPFRVKVKNKLQEYTDDEDLLKGVDHITRIEGLLEFWLMYVDRLPQKK